MNGTAAPDERLMKKRALEAELETIRHQKAEVLRAIQQIAKKQKLGGPPSRGAALTHEAKVEQEMRQHQEHKRRMWGACTKILAELLKNSNVRLYFGEPVHRDKFPGYYETIKEPRDLGTIKANIEIGHFKDVRGFRDDVRLCFANCRAYNPIGHPVRKFGDSASDQFEKKWDNRKVEEEWDAELERHRLSLARLDAEAKSLPDKMREVEAELADLAAKAAARSAAPPPGPGREMTFEEKRKLSLALGALPGERLARVLEIVAEGPAGALPPEGDEEFELDVDALDAGTLWKLQAYVDSVAAEAEAKVKAGRPGDAAAAEGGAPAQGPADGGAAAAAPAPAGAENAGSEEVGSKGNGDSTGADPSKKAGPRGQDMTTFVSATGPGAQPGILRNAAQKKDVQLQNAGAWANLQAAPAQGGAGPAPAAAAPDGAAPADGAPADGAAPMEDDTLWTEFQGREVQEQQAEAQKKALEEAERARQAERAAAAERAAVEAAAAEERRRAEEAAAAARAEEEKLAREAAALKELDTMGDEDAAAEAMRQAGHGPDVQQVGLVVRQDEDDEDDLEI